MHPKSGKDFEILFNELEAWRLNETKKIKNSTELKADEKVLALEQLLNMKLRFYNKLIGSRFRLAVKTKQIRYLLS